MGLIWVKRLLSKAQQSSGVRGMWQGGTLSPTVSASVIRRKKKLDFIEQAL